MHKRPPFSRPSIGVHQVKMHFTEDAFIVVLKLLFSSIDLHKPRYKKQYGGDFIVNMYFFSYVPVVLVSPPCPSLKVSLVLHPIDYMEVKPAKYLVVLGYVKKKMKSYRKSFIFPFNNICRKKKEKTKSVTFVINTE